MVADFWQDLRFSMRMLKTKPGFTLAATLALALGIGANTAIFSVMMTVLVRPLPFKEPESLVYLWNTNQALGVSQGYFTEGDIIAFRERAASCAQITAWTITGVDVKDLKPERVEGMLVNTNFFQTLGVQPLLGRAFVKDDDGGALGLMLALWAVDVLRSTGPSSIPRLSEVTINAQALWFALGVSILTGAIFGLAPAWQSSNPDLHHALKDSSLPATASPRGQRFRQLLNSGAAGDES